MLRRTRGPYSVRFRPHEPAANAMGAGGSVQLGGDAVDADAAKLAFSAIFDELKDASTGKSMLDLGYSWVVLDDCWHPSRDANGTLVPFPRFFPHGMKCAASAYAAECFRS